MFAGEIGRAAGERVRARVVDTGGSAQALFAWLIADGDMHLKNLSMLKITDPGNRTFRSVRLAPLYDAVTTRVFPRLKRDRLALKMNGKDDRLRRADFRALASSAGVKSKDAERAMDEMIESLKHAADNAALPKPLRYSPGSKAMAGEMLDIVRLRIESFK